VRVQVRVRAPVKALIAQLRGEREKRQPIQVPAPLREGEDEIKESLEQNQRIFPPVWSSILLCASVKQVTLIIKNPLKWKEFLVKKIAAK